MDLHKILENMYARFGRKKAYLTNEQQTIVEALNAMEKPKSIMFFTMHKCASSFMNRLFSTITLNSDYKLVNYGSEIWTLGDHVDIVGPYDDFLEQSYDRLYKTRGVIYAPQRKPLSFPGIENFKHIFFLRDPRDVLVSSYYSFAYSHAAPKGEQSKKKFDQKRTDVQEQGIDEYAMCAAVDWLKPLYGNYRMLRESSRDYLYLTYDEFKDDTEKFVHDISNFLGLSVSPDTVIALASAAAPVQDKNDSSNHKRSGKSQQYIKELKPETVTALNNLFIDVFEYWSFNK